jgi:hypothetical protein
VTDFVLGVLIGRRNESGLRPERDEVEGLKAAASSWAYADNLNWGMEVATRSANRVARAIDRA